MKYKVGDRVKIKEDLTECWNTNPKMEKWQGKVMTIRECKYDGYKMREDEKERSGEGWYWSETMIEGKADFTKSDLQDGDIVTQRDGRHKKVCGKNLEGIYEYTCLAIENYTEDLLDKDGDTDFDIIKVERPPKNAEIVYERKEEILDKSEKEYLGNVIRPFRDKVKGIVKEKCCGKCYVSIDMISDSNIDFPVFEITAMYKNMEVGKLYTLEELGLQEDNK